MEIDVHIRFFAEDMISGQKKIKMATKYYIFILAIFGKLKV